MGAPGTNARFIYQAGGVGSDYTPGVTEWRASLGRYWAHEFAERIVPQTANDPSTVWLLTRWGTFRKFSGLSGGFYTTRLPSDEYRSLQWTGTQWKLYELDGTVRLFDSQGLWQGTKPRNDNGPGWVGHYSATTGQLERVDFPDGRHEEFSYLSPTGKLWKIHQVQRGVGTAYREWVFTWDGDNLTRIDRPDGTALRYEYHPTLTGYMTRMIEVGTDASERIAGAWSYDPAGNVDQTWRGAATPADPAASEVWSFAYDNTANPTQTTATPLLGTEVVYTFDRDPASTKPRILSISGDCPTCGAQPNSEFVYPPSGANVMRPTIVRSGRALGNPPQRIETAYEYSSFGRVTRKTEVSNDPLSDPDLPRITEWEYHPTFPGLVTRIEGPYPASQTGSTRVTTMTYNATTGDLESKTIDGVEATATNGSFSLTTTYTPANSAGRPTVVNPPGFNSDDATLYEYNAAGANGLLVTKKTEPLGGGDTLYGYSDFNEPNSVTDPNAMQTTTVWNPTTGRRQSTTVIGGTESRVTSYHYDPFGAVFCTVLPAGNAIEAQFDSSGRQVAIVRGKALVSPLWPNCLDTSEARERMLWELNKYGHRTNEKKQRDEAGGGDNWVTHAETAYVYTTRCHLDQTIQAPNTAQQAITEYGYNDCAGNLTDVWDPNHPRATYPTTRTTHAYDALNRLVTTTQPWGGNGGGSLVTTYGYDPQDHLVSVTDGEGSPTGYVYSDRDLMTSQVSLVSGTTSYTFNPHGELAASTDARAVTTTRTVNAADKVETVAYSDASPTTVYTYGTSAATHDKGRLTQLSRGTIDVIYTYDAFGRVSQDGALSYGYDLNGNVASIVYPDGMTATYSRDRMDREVSLVVQESGGPATTVVSDFPAATYRAFGPLDGLTFGTTPARSEVRAFDARYLPLSIAVSNGLFAWGYTVDAAGNVTLIDDTTSGDQDRTLGYQEWQSYLTFAQGPWGAKSWTYDRIGNRLREYRPFNDTDEYSFEPNASGGHTAWLNWITFALPGFYTRFYDPGLAGYLDRTTSSSQSGEDWADFTFDGAGTLVGLDSGKKPLAFAYDGRGFLTAAMIGDVPYQIPTYDSQGRLLSTLRTPYGGTEERTNMFYFAGRPVAQWIGGGKAGLGQLVFLTTDHLGTPALALNADATVRWSGGFEPFGRDWQEGSPNGALENGIFLRLPGQWDDAYWHRDPNGDFVGADLYYNVHRWYEPETGRYTSPDPYDVYSRSGRQLFGYSFQNPLRFVDRLGLFAMDPSCEGNRCNVGWAGQPSWLQMRQLMNYSCAKLAEQITDSYVRSCTEERCNRGKLSCEDPAGDQGCGRSDIRAYCMRSRPGKVFICPRNWTQFAGDESGDFIVHEFAHTCGWEHGDGKGVPFDDVLGRRGHC